MSIVPIYFPLLLIGWLPSMVGRHLSAQNIWVGGHPACPHCWEYSKNWSKKTVPDWRSMVEIRDVKSSGGFFPIIKTKVDTITSLNIHSGGRLLIASEAELVIDGSGSFQNGLINFGIIHNEGYLKIRSSGIANILNKGIFINKGLITIEWEDMVRQLEEIPYGIRNYGRIEMGKKN